MPLILSQSNLRPLLNDGPAMDDAFAAIDAGFREHEEGKAPRFAAQEVPFGQGNALRLSVGSSESLGGSLRAGPGRGRSVPDSYVNLLFDSNDGHLLAVIAGDELNALRTAIPAGAAARRLAKDGARTLGMIGSGRQARNQAQTIVNALPDLDRLLVYSPTEAHREAFAVEMAPSLGLSVEPVSNPRDAIEPADLFALTASAREPVFEAGWMPPGALAISINSAQIPAELVTDATVILGYRGDRVGQPYAGLVESGQWSLEQAATYGELVAGARPGRQNQDERILADMMGLGVWDVAVLHWAYQWAVTHEVGTEFHLSS